MAAKMMRAIRVTQFGGPDVLKLAEVAVPTPGDGEVLIRVRSAGVNPVETYIRSGNYGVLPQLPFTPGSDAAGEVAGVGSGVDKFKAGDRVFTARTLTGSYAQYTLASAKTTFPLSASLSFQHGADLGVPYFTAYKALKIRGGLQAGETVLVHGASGAVGLAACQIAREFGCHVIGTAGTEAGEELVRKCGAHQTFNHRQEGYMKKIAESASSGVDVLIEMLANVNLEKDASVMASRGRILVVGSRGSLDFNPRCTMPKELDIKGVALGSTTQVEFDMIGSAIVTGCENGWIKPEVGVEFPLEDAAAAHIDVIEHSAGTQGRIVLAIP